MRRLDRLDQATAFSHLLFARILLVANIKHNRCKSSSTIEQTSSQSDSFQTLLFASNLQGTVYWTRPVTNENLSLTLFCLRNYTLFKAYVNQFVNWNQCTDTKPQSSSSSTKFSHMFDTILQSTSSSTKFSHMFDTIHRMCE